MRLPARLVAAASVTLAVAACTTDSEPKTDPNSTSSILRWHGCTAEIETTFLSKHRCGTLTVPQDRTDPHSRTLDLAVLQVWPVGVKPREGLGTAFGDNLGDPASFDGNAAVGATRMRSIGVELAPRGASPSSPTLACPDVEALATQAAGLPDNDPGLRGRFIDGVAACANRLRDAGIEPADFDTAAAAADLDDLRKAMGVESWARAGSYGTQSRVLFRYLRDYPGRIEAAYVDSPWFPETDDLTGGVLGTRSAMAELFAACESDEHCNRGYPDLAAAWARALRRTASAPLTGIGRAGDGRPVEVVVDDAKLLRFVRYSLGGEGPENLTWLPQLIGDAAVGRLNGHLADLVASDPTFCAGYRPACRGKDGFSQGVYLTALCKEQLPALDQAALGELVAGDPAYQQVFTRSPYVEACSVWDTPGAEAPAPADPRGTPLLLLPGQFDSFSRPQWSEARAEEWKLAWAFIAPNNTHNTLGYDECGLSVRNAWIATPTNSPDPALCTKPLTLTFP